MPDVLIVPSLGLMDDSGMVFQPHPCQADQLLLLLDLDALK